MYRVCLEYLCFRPWPGVTCRTGQIIGHRCFRNHPWYHVFLVGIRWSETVLVLWNVLYTLVCLFKLLTVQIKQYASTKWYVNTSIVFYFEHTVCYSVTYKLFEYFSEHLSSFTFKRTTAYGILHLRCVSNATLKPSNMKT